MGQSHLPLASGSQHVKAFERAGWTCAKALTKDKHYVLHKDGCPHHLSIPKVNEVKRGLLAKQVKLAGMTDEEYADYFRKRKP